MSTYDENRYLDVTVFRDGSFEKSGPFPIDTYFEELDKEMDVVQRSLQDSLYKGDVDEMMKDLKTLQKMKELLEDIWGLTDEGYEEYD